MTTRPHLNDEFERAEHVLSELDPLPATICRDSARAALVLLAQSDAGDAQLKYIRGPERMGRPIAESTWMALWDSLEAIREFGCSIDEAFNVAGTTADQRKAIRKLLAEKPFYRRLIAIAQELHDAGFFYGLDD